MYKTIGKRQYYSVFTNRNNATFSEYLYIKLNLKG